jgi:hypothetical protein
MLLPREKFFRLLAVLGKTDVVSPMMVPYDMVASAIDRAAKEGWLIELVDEAVRQFSNNPALAAIKGELEIETVLSADELHSARSAETVSPNADKEERFLDSGVQSVPRGTGYQLEPEGLAPSYRKPLDVSAFAPGAVEQGDDAIVQIYIHRPEHAALAAALAKESDTETTRRKTTTLLVDVAFGQRIDIALEAPGAQIEMPAQYLIWRGNPRSCEFVLRPASDAGSTITVRAFVSIDGAPAGSLRFRLPVLNRVVSSAKFMRMMGDAARRYSHAFLSYASPDRVEVLKHAQLLSAIGIEFFHDLLSLEPGERWQRRLYEEIDQCDVFLLFWSTNAAASKWVVAEAEHALSRQAGLPGNPPDILPIVLEGPPVPAPPDSLKDIHFNDWLRYVIAAEEAKPAT